MAGILLLTDLPTQVQSAELAQSMVDAANATASRVAPCLASADPAPSTDQVAEAKMILIGAVMRWTEAGAGALTTQSVGTFSVTMDTRNRPSGYRLWPSEIEQLQDICASDDGPSAFGIDTAGTNTTIHALVCSIRFGGACSCGAVFAGSPVYELP